MQDTSFLGEIRMFAGDFEPEGWLKCDGRLLRIGDHDALYKLIGTVYGGDGIGTFALPDMRGRIPVHNGNEMVVGQMAGEETVTLTEQQLPVHSHTFYASGNIANSPSPKFGVIAKSTQISAFLAGNSTPAITMDGASIDPSGDGKSHSNMQACMTVSFIISMEGNIPAA